MLQFKDRLKEAMAKAGVSAAELSRLTGISKAGISQYTSGKYIPKPDALFKISSALGVSQNHLMGHSERGERARRLAILGQIACGSPALAAENFDGYTYVDAGVDADFCLIARGDSMIDARIIDGDTVFVKKCDMANNGEIAAVVIDNEATLKRVYYYPENAKLVLFPENKKYEPLVYEGERLNEIRIIGKAVAFRSEIK